MPSMNDKLDVALKSTNVVVLSDDKSTGMLFRNVGFNNVEIFKTDLASVLPAITDEKCDLLVVETVFDDEPTTHLIRSIRQGEIGKNIFLPIITLILAGDAEAMGANINAGADDVVVKPLSVKLIHDRIGGFLRRKVQYSVTPDYIGPNRRPRERTNQANDGLIDVPNTLRAKSEGNLEAASQIRAQVSKASHDINGARVSVLGNHINFLISRIIAEPENFETVVENIRTVAEDFTARLGNTNFSHISEMCQILNKVIDDLAGIEDKRNVELLILLGQAISLSFKDDKDSRMRSMEVIELIKSKL